MGVILNGGYCFKTFFFPAVQQMDGYNAIT